MKVWRHWFVAAAISFPSAVVAQENELDWISTRPCSDFSNLVFRLDAGADFSGFTHAHQVDAMIIWSYLLGANQKHPDIPMTEFTQTFISECNKRKVFPSSQIVTFWMNEIFESK